MRDTAGSAAAPAARWRKFRRGSFSLNLPSHHSITSSARATVVLEFFLSNQIAVLPCWRVRGIFLAPEAERFLGRPVGIAEQHTLALGLKVIIRPRRHHENIVRLERKIQFTDTRASTALDYVEHRAVGTAKGLTGKAVRHPLDENGV